MNIKKAIIGTTVATCLLATSIPVMAASQIDTTTTTTTATTQTQTNAKKGERKDFLKSLVTDGVVSEDTYNAMKTYMEENKPSKPMKDSNATEDNNANASDQAKPPRPDGDKPEKPDGDKPEKPDESSSSGTDARVEKKPAIRTDMFDAMLKADVITQTDYDAIIAYFA